MGIGSINGQEREFIVANFTPEQVGRTLVDVRMRQRRLALKIAEARRQAEEALRDPYSQLQEKVLNRKSLAEKTQQEVENLGRYNSLLEEQQTYKEQLRKITTQDRKTSEHVKKMLARYDLAAEKESQLYQEELQDLKTQVKKQERYLQSYTFRFLEVIGLAKTEETIERIKALKQEQESYKTHLSEIRSRTKQNKKEYLESRGIANAQNSIYDCSSPDSEKGDLIAKLHRTNTELDELFPVQGKNIVALHERARESYERNHRELSETERDYPELVAQSVEKQRAALIKIKGLKAAHAQLEGPKKILEHQLTYFS